MADWLSGLAQNLLASALAGGAVWLWAHRHIRRLHAKLDGLHAKLGPEPAPIQLRQNIDPAEADRFAEEFRHRVREGRLR
jgi:hypothetical protein